MIHINFFDLNLEEDNKKADEILKTKKVIHYKPKVEFAYLMLRNKKTDYFDVSNELDMQKAEILLEDTNTIFDGIIPFYYRMIIWSDIKNREV